jgi:hypothetical protein
MLSEIKAYGGKVVGVTSQDVDFTQGRLQTIDDIVSWRNVVPPIEIVTDSDNTLAEHLGVFLSPPAPGHPYGYKKGGKMAQPACVAVDKSYNTLFEWIKKPSFANGLGAVGRPAAEDIWAIIQAQLHGEQVSHKETQIHNGLLPCLKEVCCGCCGGK